MQLQNFTQLAAAIVQVRILRAVKAGPLGSVSQKWVKMESEKLLLKTENMV